MTFAELSTEWKDTPDYHYSIATRFQKYFPELHQHRKWIKDNKYGFGEDSFHGVWLQLATELPDGFKFLELGVYKGQSISAIALSAKLLNKSCTTYGLSSFNGSDGTYYEHREGYDKDVLDLFQLFTPENPPVLIKGYTADQEAIAKAAQYAPYDCIYVDADHTYDATIHDLTVYSPMVKVGGYLLSDDSAMDLNLPTGWFKGFKGSTDACNVFFHDSNFKFIINVGHLRIYQRI